MIFTVEVISRNDFNAWVSQQQRARAARAA
jgi:heme/copper-type cytochrome/quinol oxidase subunit 2